MKKDTDSYVDRCLNSVKNVVPLEIKCSVNANVTVVALITRMC